MTQDIVDSLDPARPVLIAGPTASGKSALALAIAEAQGGVIVNADALQAFDAWPILTARPGAPERARAPHALYGRLPYDAAYSVGDWLRDAAPFLEGRPIFVGGTGLYFAALTEGLAEIPPVAPEIRAESAALLARGGLAAMAAALDAETRARTDTRNPARVARAWEVLRATGRGLAEWQRGTRPPLLPLERAQALLIEAPAELLNTRIAARFDAMLEAGLLGEARAEARRWNPALLSSKALGAREMVAHVRGEIALSEAREAALLATRQYAKRQRTWFRARMGAWRKVAP
jgi:tRNA dimethylallyltransferase